MKNDIVMVLMRNSAEKLDHVVITKDMFKEFESLVTEIGCTVLEPLEQGVDNNFYYLPEEIQEEVRSVLKVFPKCTVVYEYGKFEVNTGTAIKTKYGKDHFVYGIYLDKDIYTIEERRNNYRESFGSNPMF